MKRLLCLAAVMLMLVGCGDKKESEEPAIDLGLDVRRVGNIIMPLEVGNAWVYQIYALDTAGNALRLASIDTLMVVEDTTVNYERWFRVTGLPRTEGWVINREDGFWFARPNEQPFLFAKFPAEVGDRYTSTIGQVEAHTTLAAISVEVTVPAGTYLCHKYIQKIGPLEATTNYYFAPGIGLVKMSIMDRSGTSPMVENYLSDLKLISRKEALRREYMERQRDSSDSSR